MAVGWRVGVLDIEDQDEVIDFTRSALLEGFGKSIDFFSHQLVGQSYEGDYDLKVLGGVKPADLLLVHTKVLKTKSGWFLEEWALRRALEGFPVKAQGQLIFYSGDISEFQDAVLKSFHGTDPLKEQGVSWRCMDVFHLLYPDDGRDYSQWLVHTLKG